MTAERRAALERAGFAVGDAADFLGMTDNERQLLALTLAVSRAFRERFAASSLTRRQLAVRLKLKPGEVAEMENGFGPLDHLLLGLFALGGTLTDVIPKPPLNGQPKPTRSRKKVPA